MSDIDWWNLLPHVSHNELRYRECDVDGVRWLSDGYIGFIEHHVEAFKGGEGGATAIRELLGRERRPLRLTAELTQRHNQACAVLYDGDQVIHVPAGQLARLTDECSLMWDGEEDPVPLEWVITYHPTFRGVSTVVVLSDGEPIAFVMPLRIEPEADDE